MLLHSRWKIRRSRSRHDRASNTMRGGKKDLGRRCLTKFARICSRFLGILNNVSSESNNMHMLTGTSSKDVGFSYTYNNIFSILSRAVMPYNSACISLVPRISRRPSASRTFSTPNIPVDCWLNLEMPKGSALKHLESLPHYRRQTSIVL